jgi:hypothetical protein
MSGVGGKAGQPVERPDFSTQSRPQDNPTSVGLVLAAPEIRELQTVGRVTEPPRGLYDERQSSRVRSSKRISVHRSSSIRQYLNREATMKAPLLLAGALIIGCAAPALADEYYVVQGPSRHCTITTTRPADTEVVTQIGPMAFKSRVEAEDRIKQTKVCEEGTVGSTSGTSSTTVIKEK